MNIYKLENIETGIIKLLIKKYRVDKYEEPNLYKQSKISIHVLKDNIHNYNSLEKNETILINSILTKYIEINKYVCLYDVDIINLIINYIIAIKEYNKQHSQFTIMESVYYYMGYKKDVFIFNMNYLNTKTSTMNYIIKPYYIQIMQLIIMPNIN